MRKSKAENGAGHIGQRKDGRYYAAIWMTDSTGKRKRIYKYSWKKRECREWLAEMQVKKVAGKSIRAQDVEDMTFGAYLRYWFGKFYTARDTTKMNARTYIERYVCSRPIADIKLVDLTAEDLQDLVFELEVSGRIDGNGGLNPKTIRSAFGVFSKALHTAKGAALHRRRPIRVCHAPQAETP